MAASFGWGTLAASSLVIGAIVALVFRISLRTIGLIMAFGAGVLISAVAFDLVEEAVDKSSGNGWVAAGLLRNLLRVERGASGPPTDESVHDQYVAPGALHKSIPERPVKMPT